jgi:hypothetical protein
MQTNTVETYKNDLEVYAKAMRQGNHSICTSIEKKYDLYGYAPEAAQGKDFDTVLEGVENE